MIRRESDIEGGRLRALLWRLAHDTRGNTLMIVAAALVPLLCLIASGIDMGRGYVAQNRLQQACDAAALAGRRVMSNGVVDSSVTAEATKFFKFNFLTGTPNVDGTASFGAKGFTPVVTGAPNSTVVVTAATTLPTSIMKLFGYATLPLSVTCNAKQDFVNTDIVLVLDTTGSMNQDVNGNDVGGGSTSKIAGLRSAVMALYDQLAPTQTQLEGVGLRLRYGVVPYSSTVNVGNLITSVNSGYVRDSTEYQTRLANFTTPVYAPAGTLTKTDETYGSNISASNCSSYGYNQSFSGFSPSPAGEPIATSTTLTYYQPKTWNGSTTFSGYGNAKCIRTKYVYPRYSTRYIFNGFTYSQDPVDTSKYKTGSAVSVAMTKIDDSGNDLNIITGSVAASGTYDGVQLAAAQPTDDFVIPTSVDSKGVLDAPAEFDLGYQTRIDGTYTRTLDADTPTKIESQSWSGCIEERATVSTITSNSGYSIPGGAYDLNIDYIPNSDDTRWSPHWPNMVWYRKGGSYNDSAHDRQQMTNNSVSGMSQYSNGYWACPSQAVRLKAWNRSDLQTYVNGLQPVGGTYHDIGMIWGTRFLSSDGVFGSDNPSNYGNMPVSKFIIFLTDGLMAPNPDSYTAYGVEYMDQRVTGTPYATNQKADHIQRLAMVCNAAKTKGISIWVIGFAQTLDSSLTNCASSAGQASTSSTQSDLIAKFAEIGKNIGALRLTH